ncbi:IclR family transcriptional regulator [Nocardioides sp.]|uniref:IclR family transcriptional regulator n=1 Tax=Nocardioides sp. TaxID=35761 RepID=UPI00286D924E|nr:IclR family transcriptional regulator [Nocardioides sp.]
MSDRDIDRATGPTNGTRAVDRAADLVATVVRADEPMTFAALQDASGLAKSTTSRMLTALERSGLLERDRAGSYVAGRLFWLYAARHDPWEELARLAMPILEAVGDKTGETVNLGVARGERVVHVAQVDARYLLGTRDWTQLEVPAHTSSLGKVLYAYDVLPMPTGKLEQLTESTVATSRELLSQLGVVRRQGFATTVNELEVGLTGIAAPVRISRVESIAALGISGPTTRLGDGRLGDGQETFGRYLVEQAERLTALLARPTSKVRTSKEGAA